MVMAMVRNTLAETEMWQKPSLQGAILIKSKLFGRKVRPAVTRLVRMTKRSTTHMATSKWLKTFLIFLEEKN